MKSIFAEDPPSFRDCMFDSEHNPGINWLRRLVIFIYTTVPDLSILTGWKMGLLQIFGFAYCISLLTWLIQEGVTVQGFAIRIILVTLLFATVHIHKIATCAYGLLYQWETFK